MLQSEAELPVILLAAVYLDRAVELFEEDDPGEGVGKCDPAERPQFVCSLQHA